MSVVASEDRLLLAQAQRVERVVRRVEWLASLAAGDRVLVAFDGAGTVVGVDRGPGLMSATIDLDSGRATRRDAEYLAPELHPSGG